MENIKLVNKLYSLLPTYKSHRNPSSIADTGASGNYTKVNAPHDIDIQQVAPIQVKQPNGQILQSTKGCIMALTTLTDEAR